jgi:hypothetical protein
LPRLVAQLGAPRNGRLFAAERRAEFPQAFAGLLRDEGHGGVAAELRDATGQGVEFAAALREFLAAMCELTLRLGDVIAAADDLPHLLGREMARQADGLQTVAPAASRGRQVGFGLDRTAAGGFALLTGRRAPRVQRHQLFERRQLLFGRLQTADDRSAAAGKLRVEGVAVLLRLLNLRL